MALSMPIPPWLQVQPAQFAAASEAGLREGLAAAQIWAHANQERAQLEAAARQADRNHQLAEEELQQKTILAQQSLAVDREKNQATFGLALSNNLFKQQNAQQKALQWAADYTVRKQRAEEQARHDLALEGKSKSDPFLQEMLNYTQGTGTTGSAAPKQPSGPGFFSRAGTAVKEFFQGEPSTPSAPKVTTKAEYDALQPGDQYIGKDGQLYQKPE